MCVHAIHYCSVVVTQMVILKDTSPKGDTNLVSLCERFLPLLEECVAEDLPTLRALRLVDKRASRVALLGLRSFTLTLQGTSKDTNVSGSCLLQHTRLQQLDAHFRLLSGGQLSD